MLASVACIETIPRTTFFKLIEGNAMSDTESGVAASADGTQIGWTRKGSGPGIVMVGGVMASRARPQQPGLPGALAQQFTVLTYDRRGTGESATTAPYVVEREFEDLSAVLEVAGAAAAVYGFSSGATLALLAARHGTAISRLVLVEPPLVSNPDLAPRKEAERRLRADRGGARRWFDEEITGIPPQVRAQFPPLTEADLANAPAMLHELTFLPGTTPDLFNSLTVPALLMASDHTAPDLLHDAEQLAASIPNALLRVLPGQWHGIADDLLVEAIRNFMTPWSPTSVDVQASR